MQLAYTNTRLTLHSRACTRARHRGASQRDETGRAIGCILDKINAAHLCVCVYISSVTYISQLLMSRKNRVALRTYRFSPRAHSRMSQCTLVWVYVSLFPRFLCVASVTPTAVSLSLSFSSLSIFCLLFLESLLAFLIFSVFLSLPLPLFVSLYPACGYVSSRHTLPIFSTGLSVADAQFYSFVPRLSRLSPHIVL